MISDLILVSIFSGRINSIGYDFENAFVWVRQAESTSGDWVGLTGIVVEQKAFDVTYAIFEPADLTPVETSTWGRIKALYLN
jgi:hypothetical protein